MIRGISSISRLFYENDCNGLDLLPFRIISGVGSTMLSAPHSVKQRRDGREKLPDYFTGEIALEVSFRTGVPLIIKTSNKNDDANYDFNCRYKQELLNYIRQNNIKYLVDLHGISNRYGVDIDICTNTYMNVHNDENLVEEVRAILLKKFEIVSVDNLFAASRDGVVSKYVSEHSNVKAIQLELSKCVRTSVEIIDALVELVLYLNKKN